MRIRSSRRRTKRNELKARLQATALLAEQYLSDLGTRQLYLTLGRIRWRDDEGESRQAPLLLLPVQIRQRSPRFPFEIGTAGEAVIENPSFKQKVLTEYGFALPRLTGRNQNHVRRYLQDADALAEEQPAISLDKDWLGIGFFPVLNF